MVNKIEWSVKAQETFDDIITYLEKEWSQKEVINFINLVSRKLELLRRFPKMGIPNKNKKNTFRTLIHKKVRLVYHYKPIKKEIVLLTFWNNLQDPLNYRY